MENIPCQRGIAKSQYESLAQNYLNKLQLTGYAPSSTLRRMSAIKSFAKWAWGVSVLDDYKKPVLAKAESTPMEEGIEGVFQMHAMAKNDSQRALVVLQGLFGLRVSEARSIRVSNFNMITRTLRIRGKGNKYRDLPVEQVHLDLLAGAYARAQADGGPLVRLTDSGARAAIKNLAAQAGLENFDSISSHYLRATCLTAIYDKTKDLRLTQEFAGHASSSTTEIYTRVRMDSMRAASAGILAS